MQIFYSVDIGEAKTYKVENSCDEHFLIYEIIDKSVNIAGDIYKAYSGDKKIHVMSV